MARSRKRRGGLHQERRLADAWIAADEQDGAAYKASAGDPIKLAEPSCEARRVMGGAEERLKRKQSAFALGAARRRRAARSRFLHEGVPLAASLALALPAVEGCSAVLTDEARGTTGHAQTLIRRGRGGDSVGRDRSAIRSC